MDKDVVLCGNTSEEVKEVEKVIDEELVKIPKGACLYHGVYFNNLSHRYLLRLATLLNYWAMRKETK